MRIAYVNHTRFPTEKAHGFQTAQVCEAMMNLGHDVAILTPAFRNPITAKAKDYYGLSRDLGVKTLEHYDAFQSAFIPGRFGFIASMPSYAKAAREFLEDHPHDLLSIRSPYLLRSMLKTGIPVILELHTLPRFFRFRFVRGCNACVAVVCLTRAMRDTLVSWGVAKEKIIVEGDGVDVRRFQELPSVTEAKAHWNLPIDRPVIGYVGSLVTRETLEKGVRELIDAIGNPSINALMDGLPLLWIVGGPPKWQKVYENHAKSKNLDDRHIRFQGRIDAISVPSAIAACDVCVYPAPKSDHPYFQRDTSPLKLFEYLAAGRPVVCADLPPIRDVVDESSVKFFEPGNAEAMAKAIEEVLDNPAESERRAEKGKSIAQAHSWEKRMQRILAAIRP